MRRYEIRIRGHLSPPELLAFPALHSETQGGDTLCAVIFQTSPRCTAC
jgi:hypothetical protein